MTGKNVTTTLARCFIALVFFYWFAGPCSMAGKWLDDSLPESTLELFSFIVRTKKSAHFVLNRGNFLEHFDDTRGRSVTSRARLVSSLGHLLIRITMADMHIHPWQMRIDGNNEIFSPFQPTLRRNEMKLSRYRAIGKWEPRKNATSATRRFSPFSPFLGARKSVKANPINSPGRERGWQSGWSNKPGRTELHFFYLFSAIGGIFHVPL